MIWNRRVIKNDLKLTSSKYGNYVDADISDKQKYYANDKNISINNMNEV